MCRFALSGQTVFSLCLALMCVPQHATTATASRRALPSQKEEGRRIARASAPRLVSSHLRELASTGNSSWSVSHLSGLKSPTCLPVRSIDLSHLSVCWGARCTHNAHQGTPSAQNSRTRRFRAAARQRLIARASQPILACRPLSWAMSCHTIRPRPAQGLPAPFLMRNAPPGPVS